MPHPACVVYNPMNKGFYNPHLSFYHSNLPPDHPFVQFPHHPFTSLHSCFHPCTSHTSPTSFPSGSTCIPCSPTATHFHLPYLPVSNWQPLCPYLSSSTIRLHLLPALPSPGSICILVFLYFNFFPPSFDCLQPYYLPLLPNLVPPPSLPHAHCISPVLCPPVIALALSHHPSSPLYTGYLPSHSLQRLNPKC